MRVFLFALNLLGFVLSDRAAIAQQINFDYALPAQELEISLVPLSSLPSADISKDIEEAVGRCDTEIKIEHFDDNAHRNACRAFFNKLVPLIRARAEEFAAKQLWRREGAGSVFQNRILQIVYLDRGRADLRFIIGTRGETSPVLQTILDDYSREIAPDFAYRLIATEEIFPTLMVRYDGKNPETAQFATVYEKLSSVVQRYIDVLAFSR